MDAAFEKNADAFAALGVSEKSTVARLKEYLLLLADWNKNINLISYNTDEDLVLHVLDALSVFKDESLRTRKSASVADVGAGGGFPGIPLALVRPAWAVTLVDSVGKKQAFLQVVVDKFNLPGPALWGRAEDLAREEGLREKFDAVFCRAVGRLSTVMELTLPFLKTGGALYAHRGEEGPREAEESREAVEKLGGRVTKIISYDLPGMDKKRHIVVVEKSSPTPAGFPRRAGVPAKKPL